MNTDPNKLSPKMKIMDATLKIIGTEGVQHVTSRKIAALAKVNVAAINYYFDSKDNAINEALKIFMKKLMQSFEYLDDTSVPAEIRIRNFLRSYADYTLEYPDVFRNFVDQVTHESGASLEYIEFMKQIGLNKLKRLVQENSRNPLTDAELSMKIFQMFSSLEFPVLAGTKMKSIAHFDYANRDSRYHYIDLVLKSLLTS